MFSSIVEGCQSIITMLNVIDHRFSQHTSQLEQHLVMIANELEKGNLIKISEIVQFSFRPQLNKLNHTFIDIVGNQKKKNEKKLISIGVFHSLNNPRMFSRKGRIKAMVEEAEKQNAKLYFFTSEDVNFDKKIINADVCQNNSWKRLTIKFPDVINNIGGGRSSHVERKLRREIPF